MLQGASLGGVSGASIRLGPRAASLPSPGTRCAGRPSRWATASGLARHHHLVEVGQHPSVDLPAAIEQIPLPLQLGKRRTAVTGLGGGTVRSRSPARLGSPARRARKHAPPPRARRSSARSQVVELGESRWPAPPTSSRPHKRPGAANRRIGRRTRLLGDVASASLSTPPPDGTVARLVLRTCTVPAKPRWLLAISRRRQAQAREPRPDPARRGTVQRRRRRPPARSRAELQATPARLSCSNGLADCGRQGGGSGRSTTTTPSRSSRAELPDGSSKPARWLRSPQRQRASPPRAADRRGRQPRPQTSPHLGSRGVRLRVLAGQGAQVRRHLPPAAPATSGTC